MIPVLRDYQAEDCAAIEAAWQAVQSTLYVAPTGTGKGNIIGEMCRRNSDGRSLVLVHKRELATQTAKRIQSFGLSVDIEMGDQHAEIGYENESQVVVATIQTMIAGSIEKLRRMTKFRPKDFMRVFTDEAHHVPSVSWLNVLQHFLQGNKECKCLGLTATPDRHDGEALKQVFESVAAQRDIVDMIEAGWLVDVEQHIAKIPTLDFSGCKVVAGDFVSAEVDALMREDKNLFGVADVIHKECPTQKTLVFTRSIAHAEALTAILNNYENDSAACVSQKTPDFERKQIFADFEQGRIKRLCNVSIVTEGIDIPTVEVIACAAPTLSRSRYAQQLGRGLRPLAGTVDGLPDAEFRRTAIAASAKPVCRVIDFTGTNSRNHKLVTVADILGGKISNEAKELAERRIEAGEKNIRQILDESEKMLRLRAEESKRKSKERYEGLTAEARYELHYIDCFDAIRERQKQWGGFKQFKRLSAKQRITLARLGHDPNLIDFEQGKKLLDAHFNASEKQIGLLRRCGFTEEETTGLMKWDASKLIDLCSKNGWRKPHGAAS